MTETNIITKVCNVVKSIGAVPKTGYNNFHKYEYRKHEDIMKALQPALSSEGLVLFPEKKEVLSNTVEGKEGKNRHVIIAVTYTITDGKEHLNFMGIGEGVDTGDKASYKAQTGAMKYALNDIFLLASEADPEREIKEVKQNGGTVKYDLSDNDLNQIIDLANEMDWNSKKIDVAVTRAKEIGGKKALDAMIKEKAVFDKKKKDIETDKSDLQPPPPENVDRPRWW